MSSFNIYQKHQRRQILPRINPSGSFNQSLNFASECFNGNNFNETKMMMMMMIYDLAPGNSDEMSLELSKKLSVHMYIILSLVSFKRICPEGLYFRCKATVWQCVCSLLCIIIAYCGVLCAGWFAHCVCSVHCAAVQ